MYAIIIDEYRNNYHYEQEIKIIKNDTKMREYCLKQIVDFIKENPKFADGTIYDDASDVDLEDVGIDYVKLLKHASAEIKSDGKKQALYELKDLMKIMIRTALLVYGNDNRTTFSIIKGDNLKEVDIE